MHLAERAGGNGEVLAEGSNGSTADIAGPDNDAVGGQFLLFRGARLMLAADMHPDLLEGAFLEQCGKTFAGRHPPLIVAGTGLFRATPREDKNLPMSEIFEDLGVRRHGGSSFPSRRAQIC